MAVDPTTVWIRRRASSRLSGDRLVVVPIDAPEHSAIIAGIAATVWRLLEREGSVSDLAAVLAEHFGIAESEMHGEVVTAVAGLVDQQLLVEAVSVS